MPVPRSVVRRLTAAALAAVVVSATGGCSLAPLRDALDRALDGGSEPSGEEFAPEGRESDEGNTDMDAIRLGDCLNDEEVSNDESVGEVASLDVVDCDEPHDSEVFGFPAYELSDYPSDDELYSIADEQCFDLFEPYVGADYDTSSLDFSYYTPTRASWKYGDRDAMCVLYDVDLGQLTGSARDSRL